MPPPLSPPLSRRERAAVPLAAQLAEARAGDELLSSLPSSHAVACLAVTRSSRAGIRFRSLQTMLTGRLP